MPRNQYQDAEKQESRCLIFGIKVPKSWNQDAEELESRCKKIEIKVQSDDEQPQDDC